MMTKIYIKNFSTYLIFTLFLAVGLIVYKDYGFNIDEKFHRSNGFYWLNYIAEYFNFESLSYLSQEKLDNITGFTLSPVDYYNKYGIVFDVPAAVIELIFKIESPIDYYRARHLFVFFYFYIGLIFFYKILINRFKKNGTALLGVILLFITPRLLGDSFQNSKDIVFLTFVIIGSYYYFKTSDNFSKKNIILFALFSAVATSVRMFGVFFPISFIVFWFLSISKNSNLSSKKNYFLYIFAYIFFLILVWPLLWENTIENFLSYFKILDHYFNAKVLFLNDYYYSNFLPYFYLPVWIFVSTPVLHLILFFSGFTKIFVRFFKRLINIKDKSIYNDFWRSKNEKKDFFIFFNFISICLGIILFNIKFYNSWRMGYFLYFFIIYFGVFYINFILIKIKSNKKFYYISIRCLFFLLILFTIYRTAIYHPYQSLYFNSITSTKIKNSLEIDYTGLSSVEFLNEILDENLSKNTIKIGVASWYPIWRMLELIDHKDIKKIKIVSNKENYNADYIYSNRISEVDKRYNNKYDIPRNFIKYKELIIDGAVIYEVFKRK